MAEIFRQIREKIVERTCGSQIPQELKIIAMEIGPSWEATKGLQIPDQARIIVAAGVNLLYAQWGTLPAQGPNGGTEINPEHFPTPRKLVISFDNPNTHRVENYLWQTDAQTFTEELNQVVASAPQWRTNLLPFLLGSKLPEVSELNTVPYGRTIPKILDLAGNKEEAKSKIVILAAQTIGTIVKHVAAGGKLGGVIPAHFRISLSIPPELKKQYRCDIMQIGSLTFHRRTPFR